jgi:hypothetical protein
MTICLFAFIDNSCCLDNSMKYQFFVVYRLC